MVSEREVLRLVDGVERAELVRWIDWGWVRPAQGQGGYVFREIDVARIRLIAEMRRDLRIEEDALGLMLDMLDQIYGLRGMLRDMAAVVDEQPEAVRRAIAERLAARWRDQRQP